MSDNLPAVYDVQSLEIMAKQVANSRLFGLDPAQAFTLMLLAQSKGLHPIQAVERYHVIQGRPAMKADAMLAEFQAHGGTVKWVVDTDTEIEGLFVHPKHAPEGNTSRFTIADAKRADLTKNPMWTKYPSNMLRARVISNGIRKTMPGIVAGIYTPEEVSDFDDRPRQALAKLAPALPEPRVDPPGTRTMGKETRLYHELAADGIHATNAEFREENPEAADVVIGYQLDRHLVRTGLEAKVIDATLVPDYPKGKATDLARALAVAYQTPEGYRWIRREMVDYLATKLGEARRKVATEEQGDGEAFEEVEGGELVPVAAEVFEPDAGSRG